MSIIFSKLKDFSKAIEEKVSAYSHSVEHHDFAWPASTYRNPNLFRRADLDIIDATSP